MSWGLGQWTHRYAMHVQYSCIPERAWKRRGPLTSLGRRFDYFLFLKYSHPGVSFILAGACDKTCTEKSLHVPRGLHVCHRLIIMWIVLAASLALKSFYVDSILLREFHNVWMLFYGGWESVLGFSDWHFCACVANFLISFAWSCNPTAPHDVLCFNVWKYLQKIFTNQNQPNVNYLFCRRKLGSQIGRYVPATATQPLSNQMQMIIQSSRQHACLMTYNVDTVEDTVALDFHFVCETLSVCWYGCTDISRIACAIYKWKIVHLSILCVDLASM